MPYGNDLSEEIYQSQIVMGTLRDNWGNNKYTYHPEYKPTYSNTLIGPGEDLVKNQPKSSRTNFVKIEAARYPRLYYFFTAVGYILAYPFNLFIRVYTIRFQSLLLGLISIFVAYQIGRQLHPNKLFALTLATVLSFQPMFSFLLPAINNDAGTNLIGLLLIYQSLRLVNSKLDKKWPFITSFFFAIGMFVKPLILPAILSTGTIILLEWFYSKRSLKKQILTFLPLILLSSPIVLWFFIIPLVTRGGIPFIPVSVNPNSPLKDLSLIDYLKPQLLRYYRETFVWYWGIFKWLGVFLPFKYIRIIKVIIIIASLGISKILITKPSKKTVQTTTALIIFSFVYFASLTLWDYQMVRSNGITHGLQGRYFFPSIGAHLSLILLGLTHLTPKKYLSKILKIIIFLSIYLNTVSLYLIANSYYSLQSFSIFFTQLSQNKPWLLKYPLSLIWIGIYATLVVSFLSIIIHKKTTNHESPKPKRSK